MSVNGVSNSNSLIAQLSGVSQTRTRRFENDGDAAAQGVAASNSGGGLFGAIASAFSQIGVGSGAASSSLGSSDSTSSSQDPTQALGAFMQALMAALHGQSAQSQGIANPASQTGADADGDNDGTTSATQGHGGRRGQLQTDLQGLLQQLAASSSTTSQPASDTTVGALQQSFQSLMSAVGDTSGKATLSNFLNALSGQLSGAPATGNIIHTAV